MNMNMNEVEKCEKETKNNFKKFIGDKKFYKHIVTLVIPIMLQQLFISIAGYVDNIMINNYGGNALAYNGVSAANRLIFILNFVWMGLAATSSIFISQYFGAKNKEKIKESIRLSLIVEVIFGIIGMLVIILFGKMVVNSYVQDEVSRSSGYEYINVILYGVIFIVLNTAISNSLRSVKKATLPLIAGICGILVNIFFNYCFIFGHFGFPELGAKGAAIATVMSKVAEFLFLVISILILKDDNFKGVLKGLSVPKNLIKEFIKKGSLLVTNELLWSVGMSLLAVFYTYKNDVWYNAYSYSQNISDLFFIIFAGIGTGTAVIIGESLGKGDFERAEKDYYSMRGLSVFMGLFVGVLMMLTGPYIANMFDPTPEVKQMMIKILNVTGIFCAVYCYNSVSFFVLRAGGDTIRAFLLDQTPTYLIGIPLAIIFGVNASKWGINITTIFLISHINDVFKIFLGNYFVGKKTWLTNITTQI